MTNCRCGPPLHGTCESGATQSRLRRLVGRWAGALILRRVNGKLVKRAVAAIGLALTIGLFCGAP